MPTGCQVQVGYLGKPGATEDHEHAQHKGGKQGTFPAPAHIGKDTQCAAAKEHGKNTGDGDIGLMDLKIGIPDFGDPYFVLG